MSKQMTISDKNLLGDKKPPDVTNEEHDRIDERPRGKLALIVEDETLVAWHLESVLQEIGLEVCDIVSTGKEAIQAALSAQPDILFMDINLAGGMDGIEAARQILAQRDVPIVFVTAYAADNPTISKINAALGQNVVIGKPVTPADIQAALSRLKSLS